MKKSLLIALVKITVVQIFMAVLFASLSFAADVNAQELLDRRVNVSVTQTPLKDALTQLSQVAQVKFVFNSKVIRLEQNVSITARNERLEDVLLRLLTPLNIRFQATGRQIVFSRLEPTRATGSSTTPLLPALPAAEQIITGRVRDEKGSGLPGANVTIKGSTRGTTTDADGNYRLTLPDRSDGAGPGPTTLVFSSVGYIRQEIIITAQSVVNVSLVVDNRSLEEIVVVGYGTQAKRDITGSIVTLDTKGMADQPVGQFAQQLQGRIAGVQVDQTAGSPGNPLSFRIRGAASINAGNAPLFVVDGFPIVGDITNINPDEIETFSVLKDASASALYGSRAANGVVLITTKRAKPGQTTVQFNANYGVQQVPQRGRPDLMNAREFVQFQKEYYDDKVKYENYKGTIPQYGDPAQYQSTNWYDVMFRTAPVMNYSLSINTAKDKFSSAIVAGYFKQQGVVEGTSYERYSLRANNEFQVSKNVRVGLNIAPAYQVVNNSIDNIAGSFFFADNYLGAFNNLSSALTAAPIVSPYNADGSLKIVLAQDVAGIPFQFKTPNWVRVARERQNRRSSLRLLSGAFAEFSFLNGFTFKTTASVDLENSSTKRFVPAEAGGNIFEAPPMSSPYSEYNVNSYYSWLTENTLSYQKTIGNHRINALVGYTAQKYNQEFSNLSGSGFPDNKVQWIDAAVTRNGGSNNNEWSLLSVLGRVNYDYKGRYLVQASLRQDGSSRFGANERYGVFPSVSVGWLASDEAFFKSQSLVNYLKLRASYGTVGNNNIGNYTQYSNLNATNYVFGGSVAQGRSPSSSLGNPNLTWETSKQFNIGTDFSLLNDRLFVTYDYYNKQTNGLLYQIDVPLASGYANVQSNVGQFSFWGHEVAISSRNTTGAAKWNTNFNIAFNRNRVDKLGTNDTPITGGNNRTQVGSPIGQLYGYDFLGVYMTQEDFNRSPKEASSEVGTVKHRDVNGDGKIDANDKTLIGNPNPTFIFGLTNNVTYKNFDLSVILSGAVGGKIQNATLGLTENLDGVFNLERYIKDRWRSPENPGNGIIPRTKDGTTPLARDNNSHQVYANDYATIKNITLGYTLPGKSQYFSRARAYISIQQALVLSSYKGNNPEASINGLNGLAQGVDIAAYPIPRTYSVGINLNF